MTKIIRNVPNHPMVVQTGKFTGRSPKDRYIVKQGPSKKYIEWGERNKEISLEHYVLLRDEILNYFQSKKNLYLREMLFLPNNTAIKSV